MAHVNEIADYILLEGQGSGEPITNLKLQKLVYYAQAWHLALADRPLFDAPIQAWIHGPVVPELYRRFKVFGSSPITIEGTAPELEYDEAKLMEDVLAVYMGFSSWDLEQLTHSEDPWIEARAGLDPRVPSSAEISHDTMARFYRARSEAAEAEEASSEA